MALACWLLSACCLWISLEMRLLIPSRYSSRSNFPAASGILGRKGHQEGSVLPAPTPGCRPQAGGTWRGWAQLRPGSRGCARPYQPRANPLPCARSRGMLPPACARPAPW